jgi:osomolarity two-component system response regulator SSK1
MPDLKAKLRAKFTRRRSGSVGTLSKETSSLSAGSSIADPQRSPLVSRGSSQSQQPPTATGQNVAETNHRASGYFGDVKLEPRTTTSKHAPSARKSWNAGDIDEAEINIDADAQKKRASSISTNNSSATGKGGAPGESATATSATMGAHIPLKVQASDLNSSDLRPPITRLPSINEQPAIESPEPNGAAEPAADPTNESSPTTDDDDVALANTPLPGRDNDDTPTPTVIPASHESSGQVLRPPPVSRPSGPPRRQSLLPGRQTTLIRTLLSAAQADPDLDLSTVEQLLPIHSTMVTRKIWVRRPGASATQVTINEEDLVDDVRDMILRKYGNSLGRQFDPPDLTLRIVPREKRLERTLGPEEPMSRTLDAYYPGGQSVEEALVIDVPLVRRTPRASPRTGPPHATHLTSVGYYDEVRPTDSSTDYFGPNVIAAGHMPMTVTAPSTGSSHPHTISVISTGQVPQIPSPGGTRSRNYRERPDRPRLGRQHTSSPTIVGGHPVSLAGATVNHGMHGTHSRSHAPRSRTHSNASDQSASAQPPPAPPIPTPPAGDMPNSIPSMIPIQRTSTPPPRTSSPRPIAPQTSMTGPSRPRKKKTMDQAPPALPTGVLNSGVPPINVLIVEDNIINLKLLEAFVKRLKVRWSTAMNGRDAVDKWRTGGFHLVLMDIQLPIMSGLDATREIRRLERVNSIGVFSGSAGSAFAPEGTSPDGEKGEPKPEDKLENMEVFKSPVIIVALTASSLQSDRHEALAAGCNDFLTKPVNFVWLERKVMEWGCMQALIDFDGWRKWKDFSLKADEEASKKASAGKGKKSKSRQSTSSQA